MTSDKDKKQITKGAVKDKVWQLTVFHRDLGDVVSRETICEAINALEPACPEPKPRVGQESFVPQDKPDYGWVRVQAVKSETCIICHKKLLEHNVSDLGECRRDLYRKYLKVAKGLREIQAHLEVAFLGFEAKHTPVSRETAVREKPEEKVL